MTRPAHWLVFDEDDAVTGCHCGFMATLQSDFGYGDSVLAHVMAIAWDEGFQRAADETASDATPDGPLDSQNPYRSGVPA